MGLIMAIIVILIGLKIAFSLPANFDGTVTFWFVLLITVIIAVNVFALFS